MYAFSSWVLPHGTDGFVGPQQVSVDPVEELPRIIVTGSRDLPNPGPIRDALFSVWDELGRPFVVVHGACPTGADAYADWWAVEHALAGILVERHPADWARFGRSGGPQRNADMVRLGAHKVLGFPLGRSPGTRGCLALAKRAGIQVVVHEDVAA